jgi:hypothetical protein
VQEDETQDRPDEDRHFETPLVREQRPWTPAHTAPVPSEVDAGSGDQRTRPGEAEVTDAGRPRPRARRYSIAMSRAGASVRLGMTSP